MIFRHRRAIALGALVLVAVAAVFAVPVFGELGNENDFDDPAAEAVTARNAVNASTGAQASPSLIVLVRLGAPADSAAAQARIERVAGILRDPGVASVVAYQPGGDRRLVSRDGRSTYLLATFKNDPAGARPRIEQALQGVPWVTLGGGAVAAPAVGDQVSADIARAALIAFPILFALTLLVFRSAVSALLPLAVGVTTILMPVATGAAVVLLALGAPFLDIRFTGIDPSVLPADQPARIVDDAIKLQFPPSETSPVYIAIDASAARVRAYAERLPSPVAPPRVSEGRIDLIAPGTPLSEPAKDYVRAVRAVEAPFPAPVGGQTAGFLDQQASLAAHLPVALAILASTTLISLFVMTRSVVLPVKALLMNLLSLCAAFGLVVLVFQDGHLDWLFAFDSQGAIESSQPVLLFAVAFGLSTDYGVFLLGRIKELHDEGLSNEEAVALGLQRTGRIVTFAAALMVIAIGCFVTASIIFIKQLGFGVAVAVLIDATIVRALLVPALMRLLGDWNWWVPRPLARLLPA